MSLRQLRRLTAAEKIHFPPQDISFETMRSPGRHQALLFVTAVLHTISDCFLNFITLLPSSTSFRTHTPTQTSCWRRQSSWLRPESATPRRSTRRPDTSRSESRTLCGGSSTGSYCWTCPCPSTRTPRRWETQTSPQQHNTTQCTLSGVPPLHGEPHRLLAKFRSLLMQK